MNTKIPRLTEAQGVKVDVLMESFYQQFWSFAEFMNDSKGRVETWKYADFILYSLKKRLQEDYQQIKD